MEWTTIDYGGTGIRATDFLNGVLVNVSHDLVFVPGYYVQERLGDMDGPALRPRKTQPQVFNLLAVENHND